MSVVLQRKNWTERENVARIATALGCIIALACGAILLKYGTVSPCGILREQIRQEGMQQPNLAGALAVLAPDDALNAMITAAYGPPTPARCLTLLFSHGQPASVPVAKQTPLHPVAPGQAQAQPAEVHVLGIGAGITCGSWDAIQSAGGIPVFQIRAWTQGYLSSAAMRGSPEADPLANMDAPGIFAWLDQYCPAHPTTKFSDALDAFLHGHQQHPH
jgi:hypothetical protein